MIPALLTEGLEIIKFVKFVIAFNFLIDFYGSLPTCLVPANTVDFTYEINCLGQLNCNCSWIERHLTLQKY